MFCRLKESKVEVIKKYSEPVSSWNGKGLIFSVKNGKGRLHEKYGAEGEQGLHCILFDDIPLIKFHADNYFCPTCEKLIAAGCGLEKIDKKTIEEIRNLIHVPFRSLEQSLNDISPLLKLLPSGYYALADVQLYPTDGDGNFFWSISNTPKLNRVTAPIYDDGNWSEERPMYLLPSQSPRLFNQEAVDYYRDKPEYRAIAYNIGSLNVLLDGHHKATAAALEGRTINTLVILPTTGVVLPQKDAHVKSSILICGECITLEELGISYQKADTLFSDRRMNKKEFVKYQKITEDYFADYSWSSEILNTANNYPTVFEAACEQWAGGLDDARINRILQKEERPDEQDMYYLLMAMYARKHTRFIDVAFMVGKDETYARIWFYVYKLLSRTKSELVENYFLDYLVNDEGLRPDVTRVVDGYLIFDSNKG